MGCCSSCPACGAYGRHVHELAFQARGGRGTNGSSVAMAAAHWRLEWKEEMTGGSGRRWATTASAPRALLRFGCGCGERGFVDRSGGGGGRRHGLALVADEQRPRPVAYWRVRDERGLAPTIPFCLRIRLVFLCPSSQAAARRVCPMNCTLHISQNISLQFRSSHGDLVMLILL